MKSKNLNRRRILKIMGVAAILTGTPAAANTLLLSNNKAELDSVVWNIPTAEDILSMIHQSGAEGAWVDRAKCMVTATWTALESQARSRNNVVTYDMYRTILPFDELEKFGLEQRNTRSGIIVNEYLNDFPGYDLGDQYRDSVLEKHGFLVMQICRVVEDHRYAASGASSYAEYLASI